MPTKSEREKAAAAKNEKKKIAAKDPIVSSSFHDTPPPDEDDYFEEPQAEPHTSGPDLRPRQDGIHTPSGEGLLGLGRGSGLSGRKEPVMHRSGSGASSMRGTGAEISRGMGAGVGVSSGASGGSATGVMSSGRTSERPEQPIVLGRDGIMSLLSELREQDREINRLRDLERGRDRDTSRERERYRETSVERANRLEREAEMERIQRDKEYDRIIKTFSSYTEGDIVRFMRSLEIQLEDRDIPQEYWRRALLSKLPSNVLEKASTAIEEGLDYPELKDQIVTHYGRSLRTVGAAMFPKRLPVVRDRRELAKHVLDECRRVSSFCRTGEAWEAFIAQTYLASMVTGPEIATVFAKRIEKASDIVAIGATLNEMLGGEERGNRGYSRTNNNGSERRHYSERGESREVRCFLCRRMGHRASECPDKRVPKEKHSNNNNGKPNPVKRTHNVGNYSEGTSVKGYVNDVECMIIPDTGATVTVVPSQLVCEGQYTGELEEIEGLTEGKVVARVAIVRVSHGDKSYRVRCCVTDQVATNKVLFSVPLSSVQASNLLVNAAEAADITGNSTGSSVGIVTRSMARNLRVEEELESRRAERSAFSELGGVVVEESDTHTKSVERDSNAHTQDQSSNNTGVVTSPSVAGETSDVNRPEPGSSISSVSVKHREASKKPDSSSSPVSRGGAHPKSRSRRSRPDRKPSNGHAGSSSPCGKGGATVGGGRNSSSVSSLTDKTEGSMAASNEQEACKTPPVSEDQSAKIGSEQSGRKTHSDSSTPTISGEGESLTLSGGSGDVTAVSSSESLESVGSLVHGKAECLDLQVPSGKGESRKSFIVKQVEDVSLKEIWILGRDNNRAYQVRDGLLVNVLEGDVHGEEIVRLVVPKGERVRLLELVHERGGHLGVRKCREKLNRLFTWPGMGVDIQKHVMSCELCAKYNKAGNKLPKLEERPVVGEPFRVVALDIVGPLPKGRGGAIFLLTYTCMATRWPEAVPLKIASAQEIAEGFISIVTRTGLPDTVLTDKGSVFTSKAFKLVTDLFGCGLIYTTPYHPQGNGVLERLHGTLKPMLAKAADMGVDWVRFTPMALFALRQMPHIDTGLAPFDLVYGFNIRGPLDLVYAGWCDDTCEMIGVTKWLDTLRDRIGLLTDLSVARRKKGKGKQISKLNSTRSDRVLHVGNRVYLKLPGRAGAFKASWEGPFVVEECLSRVNYRIGGCGLPPNGRVVHLNNLKLVQTRDESVKHVMRAVVAEEDTEDEKPERLGPDKCVGYNEQELNSVLNRHAAVFSNSPGLYTKSEVRLETKSNIDPVNQPVRRVPFGLREGVKVAVEKLVNEGIVERADESRWCSPIVPVRKPDGSVRVCVDYRALNDATPQIRHHMPTLEELVDKAGSASVLSTLDLTAGFHQIQLAPECLDLTTFVCPKGKFRFTRLPFGHKNAPAYFQQMVDSVLRECDFAAGYIDDILVYSSDWSSHLRDLNELFSILYESGLRVKREKCRFGRREVLYLGHIVGNGRLTVPEERVRAVQEWPRPTKKCQLKTFLGTVGYYRKFIPRFAELSAVLTPLTTREACDVVLWTSECKHAFSVLCMSLCDSVVLHVPRREEVHFVLHTDASGTAVGACLHVRRGDVLLPVAFYSRQLRGAELRYTISEKEALAIVSSMDHFDCYCYGRRVDVVTDHKPNLALVSGESHSGLNPRLRRFSLKLMGRIEKITYLPGDQLTSADGLSRMFEQCIDPETSAPYGVLETDVLCLEEGGCEAPDVSVDLPGDLPGGVAVGGVATVSAETKKSVPEEEVESGELAFLLTDTDRMSTNINN